MAVQDSVQARKDAATHFLQSVVAGRIEDGYREYVDMRGKHHNPFLLAGFPSLQKAMMENHSQFPNKQIKPINVLGDGDMVAVHSHLLLKPGDTGMTVVHLFRFHGNRIVELWDCGQPVPADSPNKDGGF